MNTTCEACLDTRHLRCRGCACSYCKRQAPTAKVVTRTTRTGTKRTRPRKPGPIPGAHGLAGRSSLPGATQRAILEGLLAGASMRSLATRHGVSRDKVRTLRGRLEATGQIGS